MFKSGESLKRYISGLGISKWVDLTVYKSEQLFRLPFAEKEDPKRGVFNKFFYSYKGDLRPLPFNSKTVKYFII